MTIAEKMFKRMLKLRKQGDDMVSGGAEVIIRDSKECIAIIWPHNGEEGTDEDSEECNGYWLDVFADGSAIECCGDGRDSDTVLTAAETKQVAGRWADYKEIKNQIKGRIA